MNKQERQKYKDICRIALHIHKSVSEKHELREQEYVGYAKDVLCNKQIMAVIEALSEGKTDSRKCKSILQRINDHTRRVLDELPSFIARYKSMEQAKQLTHRDIVDEIMAADKEFGISVTRRNRRQGLLLCTTTDNIVFEDFDFGTFTIQLSPESIRDYKVIANGPQECPSDNNVTHPHISSNILCEGEGTAPIINAANDGRIYDMLFVIRQVVNTYQGDSAYKRVDEWAGTGSCNNCGYHGELSYCEGCDNDYCEECMSACARCDNFRCDRCLYICSDCNNRVCNRCMQRCANCSNVICENCVYDGGLCEECYDEKKEQEEQERQEQELNTEITKEIGNECRAEDTPSLLPDSVE